MSSCKAINGFSHCSLGLIVVDILLPIRRHMINDNHDNMAWSAHIMTK